jgi:hypothetical protein
MSFLAHGGQLKTKDLKLPGEGQVSLHRFVEATEEQVRIALRKAINVGPFSKQQLVDWDSVIFG